MPTTLVHRSDGSFDLQMTIAAETNIPAITAAPGGFISPHHPIKCPGALAYHGDDGHMECAHATTGPDDLRTQAAVQMSIGMLLIELARDTL